MDHMCNSDRTGYKGIEKIGVESSRMRAETESPGLGYALWATAVHIDPVE